MPSCLQSHRGCPNLTREEAPSTHVVVHTQTHTHKYTHTCCVHACAHIHVCTQIRVHGLCVLCACTHARVCTRVQGSLTSTWRPHGKRQERVPPVVSLRVSLETSGMHAQFGSKRISEEPSPAHLPRPLKRRPLGVAGPTLEGFPSQHWVVGCWPQMGAGSNCLDSACSDPKLPLNLLEVSVG